jgi:co-chaperonin GroES (HSP10)
MVNVSGKLRPIKDNVVVTDIEFGEEKTKGGIILLSDDGKNTGIHPRWGKVYAVGDVQQDVQIGDWILIEHGRWSRGINHEDENGNEVVIYFVDTKSIMMVSDTRPEDVLRAS